MFCASCGADLPSGAAFCPSCGLAAPKASAPAAGPATDYAYAPPTTAYEPAPYVAPAPTAAPQQPVVTQGAAVAALLLNIFIWPGLGTLVAGDKKGWTQGFLNLGGLILIFTIVGAIVGIPMMIAAWIWGIVSGVNLLNGKPA